VMASRVVRTAPLGAQIKITSPKSSREPANRR